MKIILMRHAHTIWNGPPKIFQGRADVPLSTKGMQQAESFSPTFELTKDFLLFSSPAKRCLDTFKIINERIYNRNAFPIQLEQLWEIDNGYFSGKTEEQLRCEHEIELNTWLDSPDKLSKVGGKESISILQQRALKAVDIIKYDCVKSKKDALVLTHGGIIKVLKLYYHNQSLSEFHRVKVRNLDTYTIEIV